MTKCFLRNEIVLIHKHEASKQIIITFAYIKVRTLTENIWKEGTKDNI
jgi:hypothetical protein